MIKPFFKRFVGKPFLKKLEGKPLFEMECGTRTAIRKVHKKYYSQMLFTNAIHKHYLQTLFTNITHKYYIVRES
ncbi:hypothetical protein ASJ81_13140 [Methanosarcina spelaei]|uniref:Uncharacterized protein n=1 Tax=Methanosarcina spelaei TaxID=1036679 RepID=A0A2A2HM57_9EURY|nr:hypothetical protein ASJ81_13140 [Methanosarcina spelaei]